MPNRKCDFSNVDWSLSNAQIAALLGCTKSGVAQRRCRERRGPSAGYRRSGDAMTEVPPQTCLSRTEAELAQWGIYLTGEAAERLKVLERERGHVWARNQSAEVNDRFLGERPERD